MSDLDVRVLERHAALGDSGAEQALRRHRCRSGEHCACKLPENLIRKTDRPWFAAFRKDEGVCESEWVVGYFNITASLVREEVVEKLVCSYRCGVDPACHNCGGGSYRDWKHAYSEGWRVRKVMLSRER